MYIESQDKYVTDSTQIYIRKSYRNLSDLMDSFVSDMKSNSALKSGEAAVAFPSAADLFIFYKKCLVQCASLSTGPPLLNLTSIFQKYLKEYAGKVLGGSLPKYLIRLSTSLLFCSNRLASGSSGTRITLTGIKRDTASDVRMTSDEITLTCTILCTSDYCLETTQQVL